MNRRAAGFTILEMMVAVVIFLIFMGAIFGVYRSANQSMTYTNDQQEVYQTGRVLLGQMVAELTAAYQQPSATSSELVGQASTDPSTGLPMDTLTFVTSAHPAPSGLAAGDLCQVTYEIAGDGKPETPIGLYISEDYYPGLEMADYTPTFRLVSPRVIGLNCLYLGSDGTWTSQWQNQTTLPVAVRIELTLLARTHGAKSFVVSSTANLMTATAAPATTTTGNSGTGGPSAPTQ